MCKSQLQTEISLSSTYSAYIELSQSLGNTIPIIDLQKEMKDLGNNIGTVSPTVLCKLFEYNSAALALA